MNDIARDDDLPRRVLPADDRAEMAVAPDYAALAARAARDGARFWEEIARELVWDTNPTTARDERETTPIWFADGRGNIAINCLDRHLYESRRDKLALIWHGAAGEERRLTYAELHRLSCKFASGLKELGVGGGTVVTLLLPPSPEGIAALLACARLGAIANPAAFGAGAAGLKAQLQATGARVLIAALDGGADNRATLEGALNGQPNPPRLIVWRRGAQEARPLRADTIDLATLLKGASPRCEPRIVASGEPFLTLPADAGAGMNAQFAHGGYAVGVAYITRIAYDLKDEDRFCPLAPGDWLAARPGLILGPLLNGATIVLHEAPPAPAAIWAALARDGVTTLLAPTATLATLAAAPIPAADESAALRLVIGDGRALAPAAWWSLYRDQLRGRAHLCANWWEPALGAPVVGTLPSMEARPGWLGKPLPGIVATVVDPEGAAVQTGAAGHLRLAGSWPHLAQGIALSAVAPAASSDDDGYLTLDAPV
jgi:acetyl-CoA synthetase